MKNLVIKDLVKDMSYTAFKKAFHVSYLCGVSTSHKLELSETAGMILDHEELTDTISYYQASGAAVSGVFVTMYDCKGDEVKTRDISRMVINN